MHNSSTESQRYLWLLLTPIIVVVLTLAVIGLWIGPATGDLTRISTYSDRDFGFNGKEVWLKNLYPPISREPFELKNGWQRQGDILVFGDSFSAGQGGKLTWLDLVQHRFNASMHIVLPSDFSVVTQYLESKQFKTNPPKVIFVQTVERAFRNRALGFYTDVGTSLNCAMSSEVSPLPVGLVDTKRVLASYQKPRQTNFKSIYDLFDRATSSVRKSFRPKKNRVVMASLSNANIFSNERSDQILLYDEDVTNHRPRGLSEAELSKEDQKIRCNLRRLVNDAGSVPLVFILVPDKRTIYTPWITSPLTEKESDLQAVLSGALGDRALDLKPRLQMAVRDGVQDVYLPNDSHWGPAGQQLAAEALIQFLAGEALLPH